MGLEYITLKNCPVKESINDQELLSAVKQQNQAEGVLQMLTSKGMSRDEAMAFKLTKVINRPDGAQQVKIAIADMFAQIPDLKSNEHHCANCPISSGSTFGCIGFLNYPISARCEQWLATLVQASIKKGTPYSMMVEFIEDQKISGSQLNQMRQHGDQFFESSSPIKIVTMKSFFKSKSINLDQVWEMILLSGQMQTTHMNYLLMMLGGVATDDQKPTVPFYRHDADKGEYLYLDLNLPSNSDPSMQALYRLCGHLFKALSNGHDVYMDS